jgi:hypothetical protein
MFRFVLAMPLTTSLAFSLVTVAAADTVPNLNVTPSCKGAARAVVQADSEKREKACYETEKTAREKLAQNWSSFSAKDRTFCLASVKSYAPTYTELAVCLEMIRDVRQIGDKPQEQPEKSMPDTSTPFLKGHSQPRRN